MEQKRLVFIKNLLDNLSQKRLVIEGKMAQTKRQMIEAAEREKASWSDHSIRDAEEGLALLMEQLKTLKSQIEETESLSRQKISSRKEVALGNIVTVKIEEEKQTLLLINSPAADFGQGFLSAQSPIGKALIGVKKNQKVTIPTPSGYLRIKVLEIM